MGEKGFALVNGYLTLHNAPRSLLQFCITLKSELFNFEVPVESLLITFMSHVAAPTNTVTVEGVIPGGRVTPTPEVRVLLGGVTTAEIAFKIAGSNPLTKLFISFVTRPGFRLSQRGWLHLDIIPQKKTAPEEAVGCLLVSAWGVVNERCTHRQ